MNLAKAFDTVIHAILLYKLNQHGILDGSFPANPVNDQRVAYAVTLKSTFCLP